MKHESKRLEEALAAVAGLPADQQDLIASEMIDRARALTDQTKLSPAERADLEAALADAKRGVRASESDVATVYAKYAV